jgi:hypothetical protein
MVKLDEFKSLNPYEQLFADDNITEVTQLDVNFGPRFSEICAHFGSNKCLDYLIKHGHELSPLLNIYRIKRKESILPFISHYDELYTVITEGVHKELLPLPNGEEDEKRIRKPSVRIALLTLIKLTRECTFDFDVENYQELILPLYAPEEWTRCINESGSWVVSSLIKLQMFDLFNGSHLSHKAVYALEQATRKDRRELRRRCLLPVTYTLRKRRQRPDKNPYSGGIKERVKAPRPVYDPLGSFLRDTLGGIF